jgi:uncharacterized protein YndB with AHSA1/START domain
MVDVNAQIDAVQRELRTSTTVDAVRVQRLVQEYRAELDDVWEAVTTAERIRRWFLPVTGELRLGGTYQLEGNAGGRILECDPPAGGSASFRATWAYGGAADTWLTVRLTSLGADRTRLELEHEARVADIPEDMWTQFGPSGTGIGWDSILLGLSLNLAGDTSVTPEQAMAWMLSEEGRHFVRRSADAWAAAHAADGADPQVAGSAADATYQLYTTVPEEGTAAAG